MKERQKMRSVCAFVVTNVNNKVPFDVLIFPIGCCSCAETLFANLRTLIFIEHSSVASQIPQNR